MNFSQKISHQLIGAKNTHVESVLHHELLITNMFKHMKITGVSTNLRNEPKAASLKIGFSLKHERFTSSITQFEMFRAIKSDLSCDCKSDDNLFTASIFPMAEIEHNLM